MPHQQKKQKKTSKKMEQFHGKNFGNMQKNQNQLSIHVTTKFKKQLKRKLLFIQENPYFYQCIEIDKNKRRCFFLKYVIIYKIKDDHVIILRIVSQKVNYNQKRFFKVKSRKELEFNKRK